MNVAILSLLLSALALAQITPDQTIFVASDSPLLLDGQPLQNGQVPSIAI